MYIKDGPTAGILSRWLKDVEWNSLPQSLRLTSSYPAVRRNLQTICLTQTLAINCYSSAY